MTDIFIIDPREEDRGRNYIRKVVNNALVDAGLTLDAKIYVGRSVSEIRSSNRLCESASSQQTVQNAGVVECNHIVSYSEGVDESWLDYADDDRDGRHVEIKFKYCPLCGEAF